MTKRGQQQTSRAPKRIYSMRGRAFWSIWRPKKAPKRPPRAPERSPRELQNALKIIFVYKKSIFQKSSNVSARITVFEVPKVILEVQNRPQEAPRENKKQHQKTSNNKRREEGQQERQKETTRGHADHWWIKFRGQRLPGEDNLSKTNEHFNNLLRV